MSDEPLKVRPGTRLGRYEVVAAIGAGGMGAVFKARDTVLDRDVAIKVLPDDLQHNSRARARFEREAKLLAALSHPNILAIHDFGDEDGVAFTVTELLEGQTLRERLYEGALPLADAQACGLAIARGLAAAHAKGILHRDLKPENIFLPSGGPPKILDFGLARLDESKPNEDADRTTVFVTQPGTMLGTLAYMSPEQARGEEGDARGDLFAFGAVLYEMVMGRPAFAGRGPADTLTAVLTREITPLPPALASLDPIVRTCLEKAPERRYRSAQELAAALEAIQPGAGFSSTSVVAPAAAVPAPAPGSSMAVLPFTDMSADRSLDYLCDGIAEEILLALTKLEGLRVVARSSSFRFRGAAEDVRAVGRALGVDIVLEGSVRAAGDRLRVVTQLVSAADGYQLWSERFDRRLDDAFAVQDEIAGAVAATLRMRLQGASGVTPPLPAPKDAEAYVLYLKARHHWNRRTETDLRKSVDLFHACLARDPGYAQAHAGLAEAYATLAIYGAEPPGEVMPMAKAAAERALAAHPRLVGALATIGCVHALYDWSWAEAEQQFRAAIDLMPGASAARAWYAMNLLIPRGRFDEAEVELRRALEVDPISAAINAGLGLCAYFARRFDAAAAALRAVVDLDSRFPLVHQFLGLTLTEMGRHDDALRAIDAAAAIAGSGPEVIAADAYASARSGAVDRAERGLAALLTLSATRYVSPGLLAQVHAGLGRRDDAIRWLKQAASVRATDLAWLNVRPVFDPLRGDERVQALVSRIGL